MAARLFPAVRQQKKRQFLDSFRQYANITRACEAAGIDRSLHYYWLEHDDLFKLAFNQAEIHATELLEDEARRRAVEGVTKEKPIYRDGKLVDTFVEIDYSDTLLIFLLKARRPDKYRDRLDITQKTDTVKAIDAAALEAV